MRPVMHEETVKICCSIELEADERRVVDTDTEEGDWSASKILLQMDLGDGAVRRGRKLTMASDRYE